MRMTESEFVGAQAPIEGYAPDGFRVAGRFREGALILSAAGVAAWVGPRPGEPLEAAAAEALKVFSGTVDVLLIGVGAELAQPPAAFRDALRAADLRFDALGTPAACRTYNVLLTEERRVAAALLPTGWSFGAG